MKKKTFLLSAILYFAGVFVYTLLFKTKGGFFDFSYLEEFGIRLFFTFPFYFAFLEAGMIWGKISEMEEKNWTDWVGIVAAVGILLTAVDFWATFFPRYLFAAVLVVAWIAGRVVAYARK